MRLGWVSVALLLLATPIAAQELAPRPRPETLAAEAREVPEPPPRARLPIREQPLGFGVLGDSSPAAGVERPLDERHVATPLRFPAATQGVTLPKEPPIGTGLWPFTPAAEPLPAPIAMSPRPRLRPETLRPTTIAIAPALAPAPSDGPPGSVCGDPAIRGERLEPIPGRLGGCGVAMPVRVTSVSGLILSQPATLDCPTAQAVRLWVEHGVKPAIGRLGGGPAGLEVAADYVCRAVNGQAGARISEHGRGRAIDISALRLQDGTLLTVLRGWRDPELGRTFRALHTAACGIFGTVLGPDSDRFHSDHLHLDTASRRGRSYCR